MSPQDQITFRRLPTAYLAKVIYAEEPMGDELALTVRLLRRDRQLSYADVALALAESNLDVGECQTMGKALTDLAHRHLGDGDGEWK